MTDDKKPDDKQKPLFTVYEFTPETPEEKAERLKRKRRKPGRKWNQPPGMG